MNGGETSTHIFVGNNFKITNVFKLKENSGKKFQGVLQDCVRTRGVLTKLIADNTLRYRGWKVTKFLCGIIVHLW